MWRCRRLECCSDDLMDGVEVIGNGFRRKCFASFKETIVVEDGANAHVGSESFHDAHIPQL